MQITWSEDLRTGNEQIDSQHQYLVEHANRLYGLIEDGIDEDERRKVLHSLVDFVKMHFDTEERLMRECDFPDSRAHLAEHVEFFKVIRAFMLRQAAGEEVTAIGLNHLFMNWFLDHIREFDFALVAYARNHSVIQRTKNVHI